MKKNNLELYKAKYAHIPGYFTEESMVIWDFFFQIQEKMNVSGDLLEIGIWKGRSAIFTAMYAKARERCVFIDVNPMFEVEEIINKIHLKNNIYICQNSQTIGQLKEIKKSRKKCRWIHVDGNHQGHAVTADLKLAKSLISKNGIICVDDFFNYRYPQIAMATYSFLRQETDFVMFFCGANKAYLCRKSSYRQYERFIRNDFLKTMKQQSLNIQLNKSTYFSDGGCFSISWKEQGQSFVGLDEDASRLVI